MITILKKEINEFLDSLIGYAAMGIFLLSIGLVMWVFPETNVLDYGYASMESLFSWAPYVLMFLTPAVTMKSFAEEKRNGTIELLYTLPFRHMEIIFGKYIACWVLTVVTLSPTLLYYYSLYYLVYPVGNLDTAGIIGSYIGLILLSSIFTSIGILASAITGNQVVSFILASFLCFIFYAGFESIGGVDTWFVTSYFIQRLGILSHYQVLSKGLVTSRDITYFVTVTVLMLYFTRFVLMTQRK